MGSLKNPNYEFVIQRPEKHGGNLTFKKYQDLEDAFATKALHPVDLKLGAAKALNELIAPIRKIFEDPELVQLTNSAYPPPKPKMVAEISKIDICVGKIISVEKHPEKEALYIEQIDVGEESPRTIVSGIAKYFKEEELINRSVLIVANLKPAKFGGVLSQGMVLAASNSDKTQVELLVPPEEAKPGNRVAFKGVEVQLPEGFLNPKHKIFEKCAVDFAINDNLVATYKGIPFEVNGETVTVKSLKDGIIS